MKKFGKRFVAFCCVAALAATCTVGASAAIRRTSGTCGGVAFSGWVERVDSQNARAATILSRKPRAGEVVAVRIRYDGLETNERTTTVNSSVQTSLYRYTGFSSYNGVHRVIAGGEQKTILS